MASTVVHELLASRIGNELEHLEARLTTNPELPFESASLRQGDAGLALYHYERYLLTAATDAVDSAHDVLARSLARLADEAHDVGLFDGVAGNGWVAQQMSRNGNERFDDDLMLIDEALGAVLSENDSEFWHERWDWAHGLAGVGAYWLERLPATARAEEMLERSVEILEDVSVRVPDGRAWPSNGLDHGRVFMPGVAHGVAGVLWLLASVAERGIAAERSRRLYEEGRQWLLAQAGKCGGGSLFPYAIDNAGRPTQQTCRLAWCHGDAGIAAVLLSCDRQRRDEVLPIALAAARRTLDDAEVVDPAICHGALGLGHLFQTMYRQTDDPVMAEAASRWLEHGVTLRRSRPDTGGYRELGFAPIGFLDGDAGGALVLLAAAHSYRPAWERLLCAQPVWETEA